MATITSQTYDFVPEIWNEIKEYAGVFPLPANIIHFDKLTFDELEDSIEDWGDEIPKPFKYIGVDSVYDILSCKEQLDCSGGKWFYDGGEIKKDYKKELFVKWLKRDYRDELVGRQDDILEFWNEVSELITYYLKKRDDKKAEAKKERAAAKAVKETPKGMIAEINKIEKERKRLMKRMKDDREKLNKLTTKGREWRTKLDKKRDEVRNSKNQHS